MSHAAESYYAGIAQDTGYPLPDILDGSVQELLAEGQTFNPYARVTESDLQTTSSTVPGKFIQLAAKSHDMLQAMLEPNYAGCTFDADISMNNLNRLAGSTLSSTLQQPGLKTGRLRSAYVEAVVPAEVPTNVKAARLGSAIACLVVSGHFYSGNIRRPAGSLTMVAVNRRGPSYSLSYTALRLQASHLAALTEVCLSPAIVEPPPQSSLGPIDGGLRATSFNGRASRAPKAR